MRPVTLGVIKPSSDYITNEPARTLLDCRRLFRVIARACIRQIQTKRKWAIAGDSDAIHSMRISLTKLRAASLFFKPLIPGAEWRELNRELRWLNEALGKVRDCDVTNEYIERKRDRRWARKSRRAALRSRHRAHGRLIKSLVSGRYAGLLKTLNFRLDKHCSVASGGPHLDGDKYCETRLREWRETLIKKAKRMTILGRKQLHHLRIRSKYYRYMIDNLIDFDMSVSRDDFAFYEIVKRMHQELGELRDLRRFRKYVGKRPAHYRRRKRELTSHVKRSLRRHSLLP